MDLSPGGTYLVGFIIGVERKQSMLSILNRVMPGGGGDLDLILDNDTIESRMGGKWSYFPSGQWEGRQISILCVALTGENDQGNRGCY